MPPLGWLREIAEAFEDFGSQAGRGFGWLGGQLRQGWQSYAGRPWYSFTPQELALVHGWGKGEEVAKAFLEREAPTWQERLRSQAIELGIADPAVVRQLERLVEAESGGDPMVIAAANMPASVVQRLRDAGYRVVEYSGPQWGKGISVGLFQINVLAPPAASARELDRIGRQVYGDRWRPKADPSDWESILQRVALLSEPDYNVRVAMAHIGGQLRAGRSLAEALQPWEAAGKVLSEGGAGGEAAGGVSDLTSVDEATIALLKRYGFSDEDIRAYLRRQYLGEGLSATSPLDVLGTGIGWLRGLAQDYRQALADRFGAETEATKLLVSLLGRAVPEGGIPLEGANYFSRLAGLPPLQQPETRRVDLGPLFDLARRMEPTENAYFGALAKAAERLGTDLPGLWQKALEEAGAYDQATGQGVSGVLEDWRSRLAQQAATPEQVAAALGLAM